MRRCHCKACKSPLHADDANADSALSGTDCSHCESLILASLRARIAFFSERSALPVIKLGLEWSPPEEPSRTAGWMSGFSRGTIKLSTNAHPPSFPKSTTSSQNRGAPPTRLKSTLQLQLLSHPLTALKIKNTSTCLL